MFVFVLLFCIDVNFLSALRRIVFFSVEIVKPSTNQPTTTNNGARRDGRLSLGRCPPLIVLADPIPTGATAPGALIPVQVNHSRP
jgi:hypothetical protein